MDNPKKNWSRWQLGVPVLVFFVAVAQLARWGTQAGDGHTAGPVAVTGVEGYAKPATGADQGGIIDPLVDLPREAGGARTDSGRLDAGGAFDAWVDTYIAAPKAKQLELEAEGVRLAVARKAGMLRLIETDPQQAIRRAVSVVQRRELPESIRRHVEEHISDEGQLVTVIATEFGHQPKSMVSRQANIGGKTYDAFTYGRRNDHRFDNKTIPLNGIALDGKFALNESPVRIVEPGEFAPAVLEAARRNSSCPVSQESTEGRDDSTVVLAGSQLVYLCQNGHIAAYGDELLAEAMAKDPDISYSQWTEGAKTLLYISIIYKDQTVAPVKTDMDAVNAYFQANSYNKTSITTTFTPVYQMSKNAMEYTSLSEIINEARALAAAGGYDYNAYTLDTIRYNGGIGSFGGVAGVGGRNNMLKTEHAGVAAHEIGHNFGLWHANHWKTTDGTTIGSGSNEEYGDIFDVMGNSGTFPHGHYNAYEKNFLNWIPTADITAVTTSNTYRIHAHDMNVYTAGNRYGLTYVKDGDRTYWLEYRQNPGWASQSWVMNGVTLLWDPWTNSNQGSQLLDTTPGSADSKDDSQIVLGRTFSDTAANVHFTLKERGGTSPNLWADVVVNVGPFPGNGAPTFSLAASSMTVQANTVVNFTATASDPNGDTLAYHWDFGDKTFGPNASTASKSWTTNGSKRVTCIVSDMKGGSTTQTIYVNVVNPDTYAISGNITNAGAPQAGVVVSDGTRTGISDSLGNYAILNVPNGTYTLTPTLLGTTFSPAAITGVSVASASVTGKNFTATTLAVPANGPGSGITREWWTGIAGTTVADLTGNAAYPSSPAGSETIATLFEAPVDWGGDYGQRMHGYFIAPVTGNYYFYIASDDNSELWLSTDSTTANAVRIASVTNWTSSRQWDKYSSQKSGAISLSAGQRYYIRALHKEGSGGDNLAVGVEYPNGSIERPMPAHRLDPWPSVSWTTASQASAGESGTMTVTAQLSSASPQNVTIPFTLSGTASGVDYSITASPITIAAGATTGSATITITPDFLHEPYGETVVLTIGVPTNAARGATPVHTATITDDDNMAPVADAGPDMMLSVSSGTPWSPSQLSPQLWIDASTATLNAGTVSIVNAGSEGGTFSGPAALAPAAIGGRQAVRFDTSNAAIQYLTGNYSNAGSSLTAFFVGKSTTASQTGWAGMMSVWASGQAYDYNNSGSAVLFNQNGTTSNSIYTYRVGQALSSATGTLTSTFLATTVFNGATNTLFLNGTPSASVASNGNFNTANAAVGCRWENSSYSKDWNGNFGEAIICNANLSNSERQKIEGHLAHRWSMSANLPDTHPYKLAAPVNLTVNLDGTVSDGDNDPLTTAWSLVSGPDGVVISNPSSVDTTATLWAVGTYVFELDTYDGFVHVADRVVIRVNPEGKYSVLYQGNGNTGGSVPVDANFYSNGAMVNVLGNAGPLVKTGHAFAGWNTAANGSGTAYDPAATFAISANTMLHAQWTITPYGTWNVANSLSGSDALPDGDPDGDSLNNLQEFAFGLDPTSPSCRAMVSVEGGTLTATGLPVVYSNGGTRYAVFTRRKDHASAGLSYTVWFSADMASWTSIGDTSALTPSATAPGDYEAVSVPFPATVPTPRFFKVGVSGN